MTSRASHVIVSEMGHYTPTLHPPSLPLSLPLSHATHRPSIYSDLRYSRPPFGTAGRHEVSLGGATLRTDLLVGHGLADGVRDQVLGAAAAQGLPRSGRGNTFELASLVPSPSHPGFCLRDKSRGGKDWERDYICTVNFCR